MTEHIDPIETARNNVLAAALVLQQCTKTGGTRAQIPGTNNLIMVGPADWIAANVPGVEVIADLSQFGSIRDFADFREDLERLSAPGLAKAQAKIIRKEIYDVIDARVKNSITAYRLAATTQASTAPTGLADILFDGHAVYQEVLAKSPNPPRTSPDNVAEVLDAVVRLLRRGAQASTAQAEPGIVGALSAALDHARDALRFYAEQQHFHMHRPDEWDTVSGEPQNYYEDSNNTATVEDGSVAKKALEDIAFTGRIATATSSADAQAAAEVRDAARYRWWRKFFDGECELPDDMKEARTSDELDAAIDRALRAGDTGEQADGGAA